MKKSNDDNEKCVDDDDDFYYRTVMRYQMFPQEDNTPMYLSSFSSVEVELTEDDDRFISPLLDDKSIRKGISIVPFAQSHEHYKRVETVSRANKWGKKDKKLIEFQDFEQNADILTTTHNSGKKFKPLRSSESTCSEIKTFMCYRIRKDACLPPGFKMRWDSDKHCTLYFDRDKIKFTEDFNIGPKDYYYVKDLNSLWHLHCFKLMGGAEPADLNFFEDPTQTNKVLAALNIFVKYLDYANEENSNWLNKIIFEPDNMPDCSTIESMPLLSMRQFITYIDDVIDWVDEDDFSVLMQTRDICEIMVC